MMPSPMLMAPVTMSIPANAILMMANASHLHVSPMSSRPACDAERREDQQPGLVVVLGKEVDHPTRPFAMTRSRSAGPTSQKAQPQSRHSRISSSGRWSLSSTISGKP